VKGTFTSILPYVSVLIFLLVGADELTRRGRIYDAVTSRPIEGAFVTLDEEVARTETDGAFQIRGSGTHVGVRAYGYQRTWLDLAERRDGLNHIALRPVTPKALYLSFYGVGDFALRESALRLIETTELNALVIDVKGDRVKCASGRSKHAHDKRYRGVVEVAQAERNLHYRTHRGL
jgi:hypothetical protein